MYLLDTDYMTLLGWPESPPARRIKDRLVQEPAGAVATSIISFEEQARGWLAAIAKAKREKDQIDRYRDLRRMIDLYCSLTVIDYDEHSAIVLQKLRKAKIRIGTMDLKIAAIALVHRATLLTRNFSDFSKVPGLKFEDWTKD